MGLALDILAYVLFIGTFLILAIIMLLLVAVLVANAYDTWYRDRPAFWLEAKKFGASLLGAGIVYGLIIFVAWRLE